MPTRTSVTGSELFIVDNSDQDWKAVRYLHDWCSISQRLDIATAYFEIGAMLALEGEWQKTDALRILMGDEVSLRTRQAFEQALGHIRARLDDSIERAKEEDDTLEGVDAVAQAMRAGKLQCRVYRRDKFHAKAYITHHREAVVGAEEGGAALVGSSNFTVPGLTKNIELNVQVTGGPVRVLQEWYDEHWDRAEDVTADLLKVVERHIAEHSPFEVYAKALHALLAEETASVSEWERNESVMFPKLAQYQKDGYGALLKRGQRFGGALLCDGVGLGKTYIGLALIERLVDKDRLNVALFVPKAARASVWESTLNRLMPGMQHGYQHLKLFNHTDLLRKDTAIEAELRSVAEQADVIVIDEAHHFRNTGTRGDDPSQRKSRYWAMYDLCRGKRVYLLTATPVNNDLTDLRHMIELFAPRTEQSPEVEAAWEAMEGLGIHSLRGHFRQMKQDLNARAAAHHAPGVTADDAPVETDMDEAAGVLADDPVVQALVVQRSRAYVKENMKLNEGGQTLFPTRQPPHVVPYSLKKVYGRLLEQVEAAFQKEKPLFSLPIYDPSNYYKTKEPEDKWVTGRQKQIVQLIRTGFLKRLESSAAAFESSCWNLLIKLLAWAQLHSETDREKTRLEQWKTRHADLLNYEQHRQGHLFDPGSMDDADEDIISPEMLEAIEPRSRDEFEVTQILADVYNDLDQLVEFINELKKFQPRNDSKLQALIKLLRTDPVLSKHKVLIFSEFMTTARYLEQQLKEAGIQGVQEVDSQRASADQRGHIIRRFAPYYNGSSTAQLTANGESETRVLISTDVLSEGLNLQDTTRIINYDLHWNPVRLMQRIGRVDRRLDPATEARIVADHPDRADTRGEIAYHNFLPPEELNRLLSLYRTVSHKILRISQTLGIEGGQLLTPEDRLNPLRIFDEKYEGTESTRERMSTHLNRLLNADPTLLARLDALPARAFSGKQHPAPDARAVFFCYQLPAREEPVETSPEEAHGFQCMGVGGGVGGGTWSLDAGPVAWYLYDLATGRITQDLQAIHPLIRCTPDTPRHTTAPRTTLDDARRKVYQHIKNTTLKSIQAPLDLKPRLIAWMELS